MKQADSDQPQVKLTDCLRKSGLPAGKAKAAYTPEYTKNFILKKAPYNWKEAEIQSFFKSIEALAKDRRSSAELVEIMPYVLMKNTQGSRPNKMLESVEPVVRSIARERFGFRVWIWAEMIKNRLVNEPDGRPLAVILYAHPRSDYNKAFEDDHELFDQMIGAGYRVLYYEVSTNTQLYSTLKEATSKQKARIIMIGGHGTFDSINLGSKYAGSRRYEFHMYDKRGMIKAGIGDTLEYMGAVILHGCSTGRGKEKRKNLANFVKEIFPGVSFIWSADKDGPGITQLVFDKNHNLVNVVAPDTYDPFFDKLQCPDRNWKKDARSVQAYFDVLKKRPPQRGIRSEIVNYLWCLAKEEAMARKKKGTVIKRLVELLGENEATAGTAAEIIKQISLIGGHYINSDSRFNRMIARPEYLPHLISALEKGVLPERDILRALGSISDTAFHDYFKGAIKKDEPIKSLAFLKAAIMMDHGIDRDFLSALLLTALSHGDNASLKRCDQHLSSVHALAYSFLVEKGEDAELRGNLRNILMDKAEKSELRRSAARILGELRDRESEAALKKILGIGLFNFRDKDEKLCRIALEGLKKIRGGE